MKLNFDKRFLLAFTGILLLIGSSSVFAQKPTLKRKPVRRAVHRTAVPVKPAEPIFTVERGTVIRARMNQQLSSKTAAIGSTFQATVTEPVYASNGAVVIPVGSTVTGRVNSVRPAANGGKPGQIDTSFTSIRLPNGRVRAINGSLTDLTAGKTRSDNESGVEGRKMDNRKAIFIGGGAVGGVLLGGAIGGGKGAAIGALLGAGAGFLGEKKTKGPEAEVPSGTEFSIFLNQSISLPKFAETVPTP